MDFFFKPVEPLFLMVIWHEPLHGWQKNLISAIKCFSTLELVRRYAVSLVRAKCFLPKLSKIWKESRKRTRRVLDRSFYVLILMIEGLMNFIFVSQEASNIPKFIEFHHKNSELFRLSPLADPWANDPVDIENIGNIVAHAKEQCEQFREELDSTSWPSICSRFFPENRSFAISHRDPHPSPTCDRRLKEERQLLNEGNDVIRESGQKLMVKVRKRSSPFGQEVIYIHYGHKYEHPVAQNFRYVCIMLA